MKKQKRRRIRAIFVTALSALMTCGLMTAYAGQRQLIQQEGFEPEVMPQRLMIREAGTYILTGSMHGTVYVDPGAGEVRLVLDNAQIEGGEEPAIMAVSGDALFIEAKAGTENHLSDNAANRYLAPVYSKIPTSFMGEGRLQIQGKQQFGVRMENADLTFRGGNYLVLAKGNGFDMNGDRPGNIDFQGGNILVNAQAPAASGMRMTYNGGQMQQTVFTDLNSAFGPQQGGQMGQMPSGVDGRGIQSQGTMPGAQEGFNPGQNQSQIQNQSSTSAPGEIVAGMTTNSAASLEADYENATTIVLSDDGTTSAKISTSGTYILSGTSSEGSITVKKGTTGVVLVLEDLDLTSSSGAALSINKEAEVKIIVNGSVVLTDAENPQDEYSADADVADAYDGAVIKGKAGSSVYITGTGSLTLNGDAKNGIKMGGESSLVIDGDLKVNITAANDGINSNYDVAVLNGDITIDAEDDGIHADHILTIGNDDGTGPELTVTDSTEGIEATVINIKGGDISIQASDDAVNAANGDGLYEGEQEYSLNMTGGSLTLNAGTDGIDSNGNVNLINGSATIHSANNGGDAGIDYDGELYISDEFDLNNASGVAGPDGMNGPMGGTFGQPGQRQQGFGMR